MDFKDHLKALCQAEGITFKDLAHKVGMNENGLHDKFRRNTISVKDLNILLGVFGLTLGIVPKDKK